MNPLNKDKIIIYFSFALVVVFIIMLLGAFIGISTLDYYLSQKNIVLCNEKDLVDAYNVLHPQMKETTWVDGVKVNFTLGVMNNGDS